MGSVPVPRIIEATEYVAAQSVGRVDVVVVVRDVVVVVRDVVVVVRDVVVVVREEDVVDERLELDVGLALDETLELDELKV